MQPRYLTGDMVHRAPWVDGYFRLGIVVSVQRSNNNTTQPPEMYPYVYYVFTPDVGVTGPHFQTELRRG